MEKGYIALHRKILDWQWYTEPNVFRLFIHLLLLANWKKKKWQGTEIDVGEVVVSQEGLAEQLGLSKAKIRLALKKLETSGAIFIKKARKFTLVKIVNYRDYQNFENLKTHSNDTENALKTHSNSIEMTSKSQQLNKENKDNKEKKEKDISSCCSSDEISFEAKSAYEKSIGNLGDTEKEFLQNLEVAYGKEALIEAIGIAVKANVRTIRYIEGILKNKSSPKAPTRAAKAKKNSFQDYDDSVSDFDVAIIRERMARQVKETGVGKNAGD